MIHHFFGGHVVVVHFFRPDQSDIPDFAKMTGQVAAGCGNGQNPAAWDDVVERLAFNRVLLHQGGVAVGQGIPDASAIFTDPAERPFSICQGTSPGTKQALNRTVFRPPEPRRRNGQNLADLCAGCRLLFWPLPVRGTTRHSGQGEGAKRSRANFNEFPPA